MPTSLQDPNILVRSPSLSDVNNIYSDKLLNCTSIRIGRLTPAESNTNPATTDIVNFNWLDYVYLDTVTKLEHSSAPVLDEGGIRHLRDEHTIGIQFVFGTDSYVGQHFEFFRTLPFASTISLLRDYLTRQGIVLDLNNFPTAVHLAIGGNQDDFSIGGDSNISGILFDNFNGPITTGFDVEQSIGNNKVIINWTLKITTNPQVDPSYTDYSSLVGPNSSELYYPLSRNMRPIISGELKLDIDNDGDLMVYYGGTIHAPSTAALYRARDYLDIRMYPETYQSDPPDIHDPPEDLYAQINGFQVTKSFNVDKTGRSAKFAIQYTQVKSNSAYPLGIRDIEFDHDFKSNLLSKNVMEGMGFRSWKHTFSGKIRIPARMSATYAWYVIHSLIRQKLQRSNLSITSFSATEKSKILIEAGIDPTDAEAIANAPESVKKKLQNLGPGVFSNSAIQTNASLPLSYNMKHRHFRRELTFNISFLVLGSFEEMMGATKFFDRLNNDYTAYLEALQVHESSGSQADPPTYSPLTLSKQWSNWQKSVDPAYAYDPENPTYNSRFDPNFVNNNLPHRDNAGTEIGDTGHHYNTTKDRGDQPKQKVLLFTTVIDAQDNDPTYASESKVKYTHPPTGATSANEVAEYEATNTFVPRNTSGSKAIALVPKREIYEINSEYSWIDFKEEYVIHEINGTITAESLSNIDPKYFSSEDLAKTILPEEDLDSEGNGLGTFSAPVASFPDVRNNTTSEMIGRTEQTQDTDGTLQRQTFAVAPNRFIIEVRGNALRAKYKIPIPSILRIAGKPAYRIGTGRSKMAPTNLGSDVPVYHAMWHHYYTFDGTFDGKDILASIETTGSPTLYS